MLLYIHVHFKFVARSSSYSVINVKCHISSRMFSFHYCVSGFQVTEESGVFVLKHLFTDVHLKQNKK